MSPTLKRQPGAARTRSRPARAWPIGLRLAHAAMALAALMTSALAIYLLNPPDWSPFYVDRYRAGIGVHKALGLIALAAALALAAQHHRRPARTGPAAAQRLAVVGQSALFALVVLVPVAGYLANSLYGSPLALPGLPPVPSLFPRTPDLARVLSRIHSLGAHGLLALTAGHVGVALWRRLSGPDRMMSARPGPAPDAPRPPEQR